MQDQEAKARNIALNTGPRAWLKYYARAEPFMDELWRELIWPLIRNADFSVTCDLATGAGRNAEKLLPLARRLYLVDVNRHAIELCKQRFESYDGPCELVYLVNDGCSLAAVEDGAVTFVYSFDSVVHFDRAVVRDYLTEFARVLAPAGTGFIHHSNYGVDRPFTENPMGRSNMTAELFRTYCEEIGLECTWQRVIPWGSGDQRIDDLDCLSMIARPGRAESGS